MLFPTFDFLLFALPILVGFWALAGRPVARVLFLLAASYFFYMAGPKTTPPPAPAYFAGLLVVSTVLDFVCGREIHKLDEDYKSEDEDRVAVARRKRNLWLGLSLAGNLGLLGYFKYANFGVDTLNAILAGAGYEAVEWTRVVLPVGSD